MTARNEEERKINKRKEENQVKKIWRYYQVDQAWDYRLYYDFENKLFREGLDRMILGEGHLSGDNFNEWLASMKKFSFSLFVCNNLTRLINI